MNEKFILYLLYIMKYLIPLFVIIALVKELILKFLPKKSATKESKCQHYGLTVELESYSLKYFKKSRSMWTKRPLAIYQDFTQDLLFFLSLGFILIADSKKQAILFLLSLMYILIYLLAHIIKKIKYLLLLRTLRKTRPTISVKFSDEAMSITVKHLENPVKDNTINYNQIYDIKEYSEGLHVFFKTPHEEFQRECIVLPKYSFESNDQYYFVLKLLQEQTTEKFSGIDITQKSRYYAYVNCALGACFITLLFSELFYAGWFISALTIYYSFRTFCSKHAKVKSIITLAFGLYSFFAFTSFISQ